MNKMCKTVSIILAIVFMCVSLFSVIYITHAINHNCSGEDCPICETVATVLETSLCCLAVVSLISQKVRINN